MDGEGIEEGINGLRGRARLGCRRRGCEECQVTRGLIKEVNTVPLGFYSMEKIIR